MAWCLTQRNTAWNKGRKCFHCLGAPNNLIRPCIQQKQHSRHTHWSICKERPNLSNYVIQVKRTFGFISVIRWNCIVHFRNKEWIRDNEMFEIIISWDVTTPCSLVASNQRLWGICDLNFWDESSGLFRRIRSFTTLRDFIPGDSSIHSCRLEILKPLADMSEGITHLW